MDELKLLGWSEEGAKHYSDKLIENEEIKEFIASNNLLVAILIVLLFLLFILLLVIINKKDTKQLTYESTKSEEKDNITSMSEIRQGEMARNQITNIKEPTIPLTRYILILFKSTSINLDKIIEYFLVLVLISIELTFKLMQIITLLISKPIKSKITTINYEGMESDVPHINQNSKEILTKRKQMLMKKTNLELKVLLKGIPYVSRMRKSELVEKILSIELEKGTFKSKSFI